MVLDSSCEKLRIERTIYAKMIYTSFFFGKKSHGSGTYQERKLESGFTPFHARAGQAEIASFRYEITSQMENRDVRQTILMDGENRTVWMSQNVTWKNTDKKNPQDRPKTSFPRFTKLNLERIHKHYFQNPAQSPHLAPPWYGVGGMEWMLRKIQRHFHFYGYTQSSLFRNNQKIPVHRVEGEWKREAILKILESRGINKSVLDSYEEFAKRVPEEIPSSVAIYIGETDLFPYQIEFWRPDPSGEQKLIFQISFDEVNFNVRFQPNEFHFRLPQYAIEDDKTDEFLLKNTPASQNHPEK